MFRDIPFVLIVNVHFGNYYVLSRAYTREPPFNHFDSTFSRISAQSYELPFLAGMTEEIVQEIIKLEA